MLKILAAEQPPSEDEPEERQNEDHDTKEPVEHCRKRRTEGSDEVHRPLAQGRGVQRARIDGRV